MNKRSWSDELDYCAALVRSRGDKSVPRHLVSSYLDVQMIQAQRDGSGAAMAAYDTLAALLNDWNSRSIYHANR